MELNRVYKTDALSGFKQLPSGSIDCILTSPPYWALRDYGTGGMVWDGEPNCEHDWGYKEKTLSHRAGETNPGKEKWFKDKGASDDMGSQFCKKCGAWKGELGLEPTFSLYISHLCSIFSEAKRCLKKTGTCLVVIGDTYGGSKVGNTNASTGGIGRPKYSGDFTKTFKKPKQSSIPSKCLTAIPFRFAIEMINRGWILRNTIIWHKCLSADTKLFCKVGSEYKKVELEYLFKIKDKDIYLPTSKKGERIWVRIDNIVSSGDKEVYEITLTNGMKVKATSDHRFPVKKSAFHKNNPNYLKIDDSIPVKKIKKGYYLYIGNDFGLNDIDKSYSYNDGLAVGLYLAEGSYIRQKRYNKGTKYSKYSLKRWAKEKGYDSVKDYLKNRDSIVGLNISHTDKKFLQKLNFDIKMYKGYINYSRDKKYIKLVRKFIKGNNAYEKGLKQEVWNTNKDFIKGLLDGYLQGDGHYDKKNNRWRISFTAKNKNLMSDFNTICNILGYDFRIGRGNEVANIGQLRKKSVRNSFKNIKVQRIRSIKKIGKEKVYDISVESVYGSYRGKLDKVKGTTKQKRLDKWNNLFFINNGILTHNSSCMPSSVKDRFTVDFEYIFFFVKNKKYYFEQQFEELADTTYERAKYNWCKENNKSAEYQDLNGLSRNESYSKHINFKQGRNKRTTWRINPGQFPAAHFAVFPEELIENPIKAGCPKEICKDCGHKRKKVYETKVVKNRENKREDSNVRPDNYERPPSDWKPRKGKWNYTKCDCNAGFKPGVVCDPFMGSGTAGVVAKKLGRSWLGFEVNPEYAEMAEKRIANQERFIRRAKAKQKAKKVKKRHKSLKQILDS